MWAEGYQRFSFSEYSFTCCTCCRDFYPPRLLSFCLPGSFNFFFFTTTSPNIKIETCRLRWIRMLLVAATHFVSSWWDPPYLTGCKTKIWYTYYVCVCFRSRKVCHTNLLLTALLEDLLVVLDTDRRITWLEFHPFAVAHVQFCWVFRRGPSTKNPRKWKWWKSQWSAKSITPRSSSQRSQTASPSSLKKLKMVRSCGCSALNLATSWM